MLHPYLVEAYLAVLNYSIWEIDSLTRDLELESYWRKLRER